jgi:tRNA G18 (ribose-2'-O)-methylase SpoU
MRYTQKSQKDIFVVLHNIRSAYNVGNIFRTADGAGVTKIFLTGYTPAPTDSFGRQNNHIAKVALGAEKYVPWEYNARISALLKQLRGQNVFIVAVEQAAGAIDYRELSLSFPTAFIFGNEVRGVSSAVLKRCDKIIEIPLCGKKESLNVAVAAGIVLFRFLNT